MEVAFKTLKELLALTPFLELPEFESPFCCGDGHFFNCRCRFALTKEGRLESTPESVFQPHNDGI